MSSWRVFVHCLQPLALAWLLGHSAALAQAQVPAELSGLSPNQPSPTLQVALSSDRQRVRVNEQILLTVTVVAPLQAFALSAEKLIIPGVDMQVVARDQQTRVIDGQNYRQSQTHYAIFAPIAGQLTVPALRFSAKMPVPVLENGSRAEGGNPLLTASTQALQIAVASAPDGDRVWLPASELTIESRWSGRPDTPAGEPRSRHILIQTRGQYPAAVPAISIDTPAQLRSYPDIARLSVAEDSFGIVGRVEQSIAFIASQPGRYQLPALHVDWWDTGQRQWRRATLPAETIEFAAPGQPLPAALPNWIRPVLVGLVVLVMGLSLFCGWLCLQLRRLRAPSTAMERNPSEAQCWTHLRRTLRHGDAGEIRAAIVQWEAQRRGQSVRLEQLAATDAELGAELGQLEAGLYAAATEPFSANRERLLALLRRRRRQHRSVSSAAVLPQLYAVSDADR